MMPFIIILFMFIYTGLTNDIIVGYSLVEVGKELQSFHFCGFVYKDAPILLGVEARPH